MGICSSASVLKGTSESGNSDECNPIYKYVCGPAFAYGHGLGPMYAGPMFNAGLGIEKSIDNRRDSRRMRK